MRNQRQDHVERHRARALPLEEQLRAAAAAQCAMPGCWQGSSGGSAPEGLWAICFARRAEPFLTRLTVRSHKVSAARDRRAPLRPEEANSHRNFSSDVFYACQTPGGDVVRDEAEW